MDSKYIEDKMKTFFEEVNPQDLVKEFEDMGYEFESIDKMENKKIENG